MGIPEEASVSWGLVQPQRISEGVTGIAMRDILNDAAQQAEDLINSNLAKGTFSGRIRAGQLGVAIAGTGQLAAETWDEVGRVTRSGMHQAAQLAADQSLDMDLFIGMPSQAVLKYADHVHWQASQVVNDLVSRHTNGYTLADRIYANGRVTTRQVGQVVDAALVNQLSAKEIARQVRDMYRPDVPGGPSYAAMRLGRTEINNAHHHTSIAMSEDKPWVTGYKWNLSKSHPKHDPCDDLADHDEGLGKGVFSKGNAPDKPHPQCLCYLTHVLQDEDDFINDLADGFHDDLLRERGVRCPR